MSRVSMLTLAAAATMVAPLSLQAQFDSASVIGYVRDSAGAALPNAAVTLTNVETGIISTPNPTTKASLSSPASKSASTVSRPAPQAFPALAAKPFRSR